MLSESVTPGNFISWRDENDSVSGIYYTPTSHFFDGYQELIDIKKRFKLKTKLDKNLPILNSKVKMKI